MNNYHLLTDMEIGTGHWNQIVRIPVDPVTGYISGQEVRGLLEFAGSDVCDTFQAHGDYIYVVCSYSEPLRLGGHSPLISIWRKDNFQYVSGVELNFGWAYDHEGSSLTRLLIPNSNMAGDLMYIYGTTKVMYGAEFARFAFMSMFDTSNWKHGCAYSQAT